MILMDVEDVLQAIAALEHEYRTEKESPGAGRSDPKTEEAYRRGRDQGARDCKRAIKKMVTGKMEMAEGWLK